MALERVAAPPGQTTPLSVEDLQALARATRSESDFMAVTLLAAAFTHLFRAQSTLCIAPHHVVDGILRSDGVERVVVKTTIRKGCKDAV